MHDFTGFLFFCMYQKVMAFVPAVFVCFHWLNFLNYFKIKTFVSEGAFFAHLVYFVIFFSFV